MSYKVTTTQLATKQYNLIYVMIKLISQHTKVFLLLM